MLDNIEVFYKYIQQTLVDNLTRLYYYNELEKNSEKVIFYQGRVSILEVMYKLYAGKTPSLDELHARAKEKANEIFEFING